MYTGSCLCGTVQYEVAGPFMMMALCHCSKCRKHHGAMFSTFASAPDLRPTMHMFAGSRAEWFPITDGLPQQESYPGRP
jgi:hypothetical protein